MKKTTKLDKMKILIGAAVAASSYKEITSKEDYDEDINVELQKHLTMTCMMLSAEYFTGTDEDAHDNASEFIANQALAALGMCTAKATPKPKSGSGLKATEEELVSIIGQEAFDKLTAMMK